MALNQLWCDYLIDCDLPQCETLILFICIATNVKELSCCCLARAGALPEITEIHVRQRARAHTNMLSDWEQKLIFTGTAKALTDAPILSIQHLRSLWTHYDGNSLQ